MNARYEEIQDAIHRMVKIEGRLRDLHSKLTGSENDEKNEPVETTWSLDTLLTQAPSRILDFANRADDVINNIEIVIFGDDLKTAEA